MNSNFFNIDQKISQMLSNNNNITGGTEEIFDNAGNKLDSIPEKKYKKPATTEQILTNYEEIPMNKWEHIEINTYIRYMTKDKQLKTGGKIAKIEKKNDGSIIFTIVKYRKGKQLIRWTVSSNNINNIYKYKIKEKVGGVQKNGQTTGQNQMNNGQNQMNGQNVQYQMNNGQYQMNNGQNQMNNGQNQMNNGQNVVQYNGLNSGLNQMNNGLNQMNNVGQYQNVNQSDQMHTDEVQSSRTKNLLNQLGDKFLFEDKDILHTKIESLEIRIQNLESAMKNMFLMLKKIHVDIYKK
jgi:hypothetical protein